MGMSSVIAADRSGEKRKADADSFEVEDMAFPPLKPILTNSRTSKESSCAQDVAPVKGDCEDEGCETPKSEEHKIPSCLECPPAPKKPGPILKRRAATTSGGVFFVPPDLDSVFIPYKIRPRKKLHWSTEPAWIGVSVERNNTDNLI